MSSLVDFFNLQRWPLIPQIRDTIDRSSFFVRLEKFLTPSILSLFWFFVLFGDLSQNSSLSEHLLNSLLLLFSLVPLLYLPIALHLKYEPRYRPDYSPPPRIFRPHGTIFDRGLRSIIPAKSRLFSFLLLAALFLSFAFQILLYMTSSLLQDYHCDEALDSVTKNKNLFFLELWRMSQFFLVFQYSLLVTLILRRIYRFHYTLPFHHSHFLLLYNGHSIGLQTCFEWSFLFWIFSKAMRLIPFDFGIMKVVEHVVIWMLVRVIVISVVGMICCIFGEAVRTMFRRFQIQLSGLVKPNKKAVVTDEKPTDGDVVSPERCRECTPCHLSKPNDYPHGASFSCEICKLSFCQHHWQSIHHHENDHHVQHQLEHVCDSCKRHQLLHSRSIPTYRKVLKVAGVVLPLLWFVLHMLSTRSFGTSGWSQRDTIVLILALGFSLMWFLSPLKFLGGDIQRLWRDLISHWRPVEFIRITLTGNNALSFLCFFFCLIGLALMTGLMANALGFDLSPSGDIPNDFNLAPEQSPLLVEGFPIEEFAFLAAVPYHVNVSEPFDSKDWRKVDELSECSDNGICLWVFENQERHTRVISIRGGIHLRHLLHNCLLFGNSVVFKSFFALVPSSGFDSLPEFLGHIADIPTKLWQADVDVIFTALHSRIETILQNDPSFNFFFVGHGRGGVYASLFGAGWGIRTVVFASPGIDMLRHRFTNELPALKYSESLGAILVNLRPGKDLIPFIDIASPLTFALDVPCSANNPITCHAMSQILIDLKQKTRARSGHQDFVQMRGSIVDQMKERVSSWGKEG